MMAAVGVQRLEPDSQLITQRLVNHINDLGSQVNYIIQTTPCMLSFIFIINMCSTLLGSLRITRCVYITYTYTRPHISITYTYTCTHKTPVHRPAYIHTAIIMVRTRWCNSYA